MHYIRNRAVEAPAWSGVRCRSARLRLWVCAVVSVVGLSACAGGAEPDGGEGAKLAGEILAKLHLGDREPSEQYWKDRQELIEKGQAILPGCIHILENSKDGVALVDVIWLLPSMAKKKIDLSAVLPHVRKCLQSENAKVRRAAAEVLILVGNAEEDIPRVIEMLNDREELVRSATAAALQRTECRELAPRIQAVLDKRLAGMTQEEIKKDRSIGAMRFAVAELKLALPRIPGDEARYAIAKEIIKMIRAATYDDLGGTKHKKVYEYFDRGGAVLDGCAYILEHGGEEIPISLLAPLSASKIDKSPLLPAIRGFLSHKNKWARMDTIEALGKFGERQDTFRILEMLRDDNVGVRLTAAKTLTKIGSPEMLPRMEAILAEVKARKVEPGCDPDTSIPAIEEVIRTLRERQPRVPEGQAPAGSGKAQDQATSTWCGKGRVWWIGSSLLVAVAIGAALLAVFLRRRRRTSTEGCPLGDGPANRAGEEGASAQGTVSGPDAPKEGERGAADGQKPGS